MESLQEELKVSIVMITYGHDQYLVEAITSILDQICDFSFELIIGNDNSPDNSDAVIRGIIESHPNGNYVKYHHHENNLGMVDNFLFCLKQVKGIYFAFCEGDDYWIDPYKLQKQVDYLDQNKDYSMLFTPAVRYYENQGKETIRNRHENFDFNNFTLEKVIRKGGGFYPTVTSIFRSDILKIGKRDRFLTSHSTGDYPIAILAALKGKIGYLDDVTSVYRVQESSVSNMVFDSCEDCMNNAKKKNKTNIDYLDFLKDEKVISSTTFYNELVYKENYILLSKYIDCGGIKSFIKLFFKRDLRIGTNFRIRILMKCIYVFIKRKGKSNRVKQKS